jgi:molecular chaperone GrpE
MEKTLSQLNESIQKKESYWFADILISESLNVVNGEKEISEVDHPIYVMYLLLDETFKSSLSKISKENPISSYIELGNVLSKINNPLKDLIYKDSYLRMAAEFENYKKRMTTQIENVKQSTKINTLSSILDSWDDLMIAKKEIEKSGQDTKGINLILSKIENSIKSNGLKPIDNITFNPNYHEAISTISINTYKDNQIVDIVSWGWEMDGKVVKWSKVIVNQNK